MKFEHIYKFISYRDALQHNTRTVDLRKIIQKYKNKSGVYTLKYPFITILMNYAEYWNRIFEQDKFLNDCIGQDILEHEFLEYNEILISIITAPDIIDSPFEMIEMLVEKIKYIKVMFNGYVYNYMAFKNLKSITQVPKQLFPHFLKPAPYSHVYDAPIHLGLRSRSS